MDTTSVDRLGEQLSRKLLPSIREMISEEISRQLPSTQKTQNDETEFFKALTEELMGKISSIYQEVHSLQNPQGSADGPKNKAQVEAAAGMVTDASERLTQIIEQTEKATFDILDRVDRGLDTLNQLETILSRRIEDGPDREEINGLTTSLNDDLLGITTGMSFQDLTGQRIKRVIEMLQRVESMTADLYVSTGILLKTRERSPDKNLEQTKQAAHEAASQEDVDTLLEQLNAG
ncbi:protein phosphatase CheZ [Desulfoplanes sp.]